MSFFIFLCATLIVGSQTAPRQPRSNTLEIQEECTQDDVWFGREWLYVYRYKGSVETQFLDESATVEQSSGLRLECTTFIHPLQGCQRLLKVASCKVWEHDSAEHTSAKSAQLSALLSRYDVKFHLSGGYVEKNIWMSKAETPASANIKRAILSTLQLEKARSHNITVSQASVFGSCEVEYSQRTSDALTSLTDLMKCTGSLKHRQVLPFANLPLHSHTSVLQVLHPRSSKQRCHYEVGEDSSLSEVSCTSQIDFPTVGSQGLHASVYTRQKVKLIEVRQAEPVSATEPHWMAATLDYQQDDPLMQQEADLGDVHSALHALAEEGDTLTSTAPHRFRTLVRSLQKVTKSKLVGLYKKLANCQTTYCTSDNQVALQDIYLDGLVGCGTGPCLFTVSRAIQQSSVPSYRVPTLLYTMATSHTPNRATLSNILAICTDGKLPTCLLPLSIMINKFCKSNNIQQDNKQSPLFRTMSLLKEELGDDCQSPQSNVAGKSTKSDHNADIMTALKALSNIGGTAVHHYDSVQDNDGDKILPAMLTCASNKALHHSLMAQAIQAIVHTDMSDSTQSLFLMMLNDTAYPMEVRCEVFKQLVHHGTESVLTDVLRLMEHEEIRQMQAYMSSFINNIISSHDPALQLLKNMVTNIINKKNLEVPTLSQTSHQPLSRQSLLTDGTAVLELASGSIHQHIEGSVLYNPGSLVPSVSDLQVSIEVLGGRVNIFNIQLEQEGLDFLGSSNSESGINYENFHQTIVQRLENLHKSITHAQKSPDATLHITLFGYEVGFLRLQDLRVLKELAHVETKNDLWRFVNLENHLSNLPQILSKTFSKSLIIPVVHEIIPTSLGLPLNLLLEGTAVMKVNLSSLWHSEPQSMEDMKNVQLDSQLKFSGAGELMTRFMVGAAGICGSGIQHVTSWQSYVDTPLVTKSDTSGLHFSISRIPSPEDALQIRNKVQKLTQYEVSDTENETTQDTSAGSSCLFAFLQKLTGLNLCSKTHETRTQWRGTLRKMGWTVWQSLQQNVQQFLQKILNFSGSTFTITLPIPSGSNETEKAEGWFNYLQTVWSRVKSATVHTPNTYISMLFGGTHIYTFDGKYYQIPEYPDVGCTYVLARDFVERNFTILSNKIGITLLTKDISVTIETSNNKIRINNSDSFSELPYANWNNNVQVTRQGAVVYINTSYGVDIHCDSHHQLCVFSIAGEYHNRTLGLLGTNDNEPANDFRKRNGVITRNVYHFLNSYEVSGLGQCRWSHHDVDSGEGREVCPSQSHVQQCNNAFSSATSALAACFDKVNPQPFNTACELAVNDCSADHQVSVCSVTEAYLTACRTKGIPLQQISHCSSCSGHSLGSSWRQTGRRKADIVVVTSLNTNMTRENEEKSLSEYVPTLLQHTRHSLRKRGYYDVRYGLVGYGGKGVHYSAHSHTLNGELLTSADGHAHMKAKLQKLKAEGINPSSALDALTLAAQYPYRDEASKMVILLADKDVQDNTSGVTAVGQRLQERGIIVDVVAQYEQLAPKKIVAQKWDGSVISQDDTPHQQPLPQGAYANIVQISHGALLDLDSVARGSRHLLRHITRTISDNIISQTNLCRQCACSQAQSGGGISKCTLNQC